MGKSRGLWPTLPQRKPLCEYAQRRFIDDTKEDRIETACLYVTYPLSMGQKIVIKIFNYNIIYYIIYIFVYLYMVAYMERIHISMRRAHGRHDTEEKGSQSKIYG